jgi:ABC-type branched-subunit amino acid transport system substrate-binding protein
MRSAVISRTTFVVAAIAAAATWVGAAGAATPPVVVLPGQPVQIAFAGDRTGFAADLSVGIAKAVRMAIGFNPTIRGFPIQLNTYDAACGDPAADVLAATEIVANTQNAGVIGQLCSSGFDQALPIYEAANVVTISGSATATSLATQGFSVFNRVAVADPDFDAWYATVGTLPSDIAWAHGYEVIFESATPSFADLYYDATSVLINKLRRASHIDRTGALIIDRAALTAAVRSTRSFPGVTCTVTLDPATGNRVNDAAALRRCARAADDEDNERRLR